MRVLVACERFGAVREAFLERGHDAWSCDVMDDAAGSQYHFTDDVRHVIDYHGPWDMLIAFPPCTYLTSSGLHRNKNNPKRQKKTEEALAFVRFLLDADIPRIALENPVGRIGTAIRPASQYIQPYEFGEDASKRTGLWLKNLPPLQPTKRVPGRLVVDPRNGKVVERWSNQTDSGQNRLGPSPDRAIIRGKTYPGIADAMANQWGRL